MHVGIYIYIYTQPSKPQSQEMNNSTVQDWRPSVCDQTDVDISALNWTFSEPIAIKDISKILNILLLLLRHIKIKIKS